MIIPDGHSPETEKKEHVKFLAKKVVAVTWEVVTYEEIYQNQ